MQSTRLIIPTFFLILSICYKTFVIAFALVLDALWASSLPAPILSAIAFAPVLDALWASSLPVPVLSAIAFASVLDALWASLFPSFVLVGLWSTRRPKGDQYVVPPAQYQPPHKRGKTPSFENTFRTQKNREKSWFLLLY